MQHVGQLATALLRKPFFPSLNGAFKAIVNTVVMYFSSLLFSNRFALPFLFFLLRNVGNQRVEFSPTAFILMFRCFPDFFYIISCATAPRWEKRGRESMKK